ncbi:hypothetical protein CLAIMM_03091 [Cladophialophora immunda]|nr:hypothetical protein CLAIMM_03091 [Cladophialophora immunda]
MPLGILEDSKMEHVPGTAPLETVRNAASPEAGLVDSNALKHDKTGKIVLVPQPSDDPNDPLNWPRWRKEMFIVSAIWGVSCVGAIGPLLTSAYVQLAVTWGVSLQTFSSGTNGGLIVCLAGATILVNVLAVKYGKRPIYLTASVGLVATGFWGSAAKSWGSFVASRAIAGFCMAPLEGLVPASIADIWFVHERGTRTALFNLAFMAGVSVGPLIASQLIQNYGWRVCSYAMAAALVINLILTFFFMPETAYHRAGAVNIGTSIRLEEKFGNLEEQIEDSKQSSRSVRTATDAGGNALRPAIPTKKSFRSPIVIWTSLVFMTAITWIVMLTIGASQIFSGPPYNFSIAAVGNTFLSSFVASIIGTVVASPLVDGGARFLAKQNQGIFEPEFRLPAVACYLLFTASGFFSAGQSLGHGMAWEIPVILSFSFINFGVVVAVTAAITYTIDSHHDHAAEAVSVMVMVKNMFAFGSTYYANDWIATSGVRSVFFTLGGITAGITLSAIPMYIYEYILDLLVKEDGVQKGYWGQAVGDEAKIHMLVNWDSVAAHQALQGKEYYLPFVQRLDEITDVTKLRAFHTHLSPYPADQVLDHKSAPVTELLTAYFPKDYGGAGQRKFQEGLEMLVANVRPKTSALLGFSGGWAVEDVIIPGTSDDGKAYLAVFGWWSMEARSDFVNSSVFEENRHFLDEADRLLCKDSVYWSGTRFK